MRTALWGLLAACLLAATPSQSADRRNFTLYNDTGYGIKFIGVNPPGDEEYTDNEISNVLKHGQSVYIKFNEVDKGCRWNIKIDWEMPGYNSPFLPNLDLCKITDIRLLYDKKTGVTSFKTR
jgi:hypothetical protein